MLETIIKYGEAEVAYKYWNMDSVVYFRNLCNI